MPCFLHPVLFQIYSEVWNHLFVICLTFLVPMKKCAWFLPPYLLTNADAAQNVLCILAVLICKKKRTPYPLKIAIAPLLCYFLANSMTVRQLFFSFTAALETVHSLSFSMKSGSPGCSYSVFYLQFCFLTHTSLLMELTCLCLLCFCISSSSTCDFITAFSPTASQFTVVDIPELVLNCLRCWVILKQSILNAATPQSAVYANCFRIYAALQEDFAAYADPGVVVAVLILVSKPTSLKLAWVCPHKWLSQQDCSVDQGCPTGNLRAACSPWALKIWPLPLLCSGG